MLFQNPLKDKDVSSSSDLIFRRTRYLFFIIGLCFIVSTLVIAVIMVGLFDLKYGGDENILDNILGALVLLFGIFLWIALMKWLVNYYYYMVIIKQGSIIKIDFDLFFREDVQIVELSRVISTNSLQQSFLTSFLDYGDVLVTLENSGSMVLSNLPKPKKVIQTIETFKESAAALEKNTTALEENTTALEENAVVPEEKAAVLEEKAAVPEENAVVPEEKATVLEEKAVVPEEKATVLEEKAAVLEEKAAVLEEKAAVLKEKAAVLEEKAAVLEEKTISLDEKVTAFEEKVAESEEKTNSTEKGAIEPENEDKKNS